MKATELRIANWVYRPDCIDKVIEIRRKGIIGLDISKGLIPFKDLKPIPLTPEILEKNGFESYSNNSDLIWGINFSKCNIVLAYMDYYWQVTVDSIIYRPIKIRYVHELQNALILLKIEKEIEL